MTLNITLSPGIERHARYTVIRRGGCILIDGAIPASDLQVLTRLAPPRAVMAPDLARMASVNFAFGLRIDVDALIAELKPQAVAAAKREHAGSLLSHEAAVWLASGERGVSSNTIFTHLTGVDALRGHAPSHPYDPDDFRRCRLLLEQVPEMVRIMPHMAEASPQWAMLIQHWDEICKTMDAETPEWRDPHTGSKSPKTYQLIKACIGRD